MLPPPLTPPLPTRPLRRSRRRIPWLAVSGFVLAALTVVGAVVWVGAFSPYGFVRFSAPRADRTITVSRPGDYLVFEERSGATDPDLPPRLAITVVDDRGRSVPVEQLVAPGSKGAPFAYHVPPHEGRAIARFHAARSGPYLLQVSPLDPKTTNPSDYRPDLPPGLAVGRQLAWPWLRTPYGLLVLAGIPFVGAVVVVTAMRRRRRRAAVGQSPAERAGVVR